MATKPEKDPLDLMLENLTPEQKVAISEVANAENISPKEALLKKLAQEQDDDRENRREGRAP
ncbi:hypothetical protein HYU91_02935 [Candidatus Collierbacteria bacterium]|nr:hypothetical protein [Candidatus Collierbacteria bacterium]